MSVRVFAYGSNLCIERMRSRAASARPLAVAKVESHVLRFHKRGRDESGKADAFFTGESGDVVWGVVYEMARDDKHALDRCEGLGSHYLEREIRAATVTGERIQAWMYHACPNRIDPHLKPYAWYQRLVVEGARQHGLPAEYLAALEAVERIDDPDARRHARELSILVRPPR